MPKFTVKYGVVLLDGKAHHQGDSVTLTNKQAERLSQFVEAKDVTETKTDLQSGAQSLEDMNFNELKALAEESGLVVEGTGKNGAVKKDDYLNALKG